MPQDLRVACPGEDVRLFRRHDRAGDVFVQVRAADAGDSRGDQYVIGKQPPGGFGHVFNPDVPGSVEPNCSHSVVLPQTRGAHLGIRHPPLGTAFCSRAKLLFPGNPAGAVYCRQL